MTSSSCSEASTVCRARRPQYLCQQIFLEIIGSKAHYPLMIPIRACKDEIMLMHLRQRSRSIIGPRAGEDLATHEIDQNDSVSSVLHPGNGVPGLVDALQGNSCVKLASLRRYLTDAARDTVHRYGAHQTRFVWPASHSHNGNAPPCSIAYGDRDMRGSTGVCLSF
eukprot:scaffold37611_cov35-Tisochrysis_lutea.AAC.3